MRAGQLRNFVTVKKYVRSTRNEFNEIEATESVVAQVWASVKPISSKERVYVSQVRGETTHLVEMRYRADVQPDYFIEHNGRTLKILSLVNVDERNERLELQCVEAIS